MATTPQGFFGLQPTQPMGISDLAHYFKKMFVFAFPLPLGISFDLQWRKNGNFLELYIVPENAVKSLSDSLYTYNVLLSYLTI